MRWRTAISVQRKGGFDSPGHDDTGREDRQQNESCNCADDLNCRMAIQDFDCGLLPDLRGSEPVHLLRMSTVHRRLRFYCEREQKRTHQEPEYQPRIRSPADLSQNSHATTVAHPGERRLREPGKAACQHLPAPTRHGIPLFTADGPRTLLLAAIQQAGDRHCHSKRGWAHCIVA